MSGEVTRTWTRAVGADLPPDAVVERIRGGIRRYRWRCDACGMSQERVSRESASEWAWDHVVGDGLCEAGEGR